MAIGPQSAIVVISNRRAGGVNHLEHALAELRRGARDLVAVDTADLRLEDAIRHAAGGTVVAAGGDGTLHIVVQHLCRLGLLGETVLGLLPLGTGNDLARTVGIPLDPRAAAAAVLYGRPQWLDLLLDDTGAVAVNAVHCGVGGVAVRHAAPLKPVLGRLAYRLAAAWAGARSPAWTARVVLDEKLLFDGRLLFVGIGNGRTIGGGSTLWPQARPDDGLADVVVAVATGMASKLEVVRALRSGDPRSATSLVTGRGKTVRIESGAIPCVADGDDCGSPIGATWSVQPASWRLLVPE